MDSLPEKTYFETNAETLLKNAGLTKARFSEKMGVARQNVQKVFETKNVFTLLKAAGILGTTLNILIYGPRKNPAIDGFIEVNGIVHRIKNRKDIEDLLAYLD